MWKKNVSSACNRKNFMLGETTGIDRVNAALKGLIEAIIDSPEYAEFDRQKNIMKENPELKEKLDEYRQENFRLQRTAESDELFDKLDEFAVRYEEFRKNPLVDSFLNAEADFCRMIQEINQEIVEAVNFE